MDACNCLSLLLILDGLHLHTHRMLHAWDMLQPYCNTSASDSPAEGRTWSQIAAGRADRGKRSPGAAPACATARFLDRRMHWYSTQELADCCAVNTQDGVWCTYCLHDMCRAAICMLRMPNSELKRSGSQGLPRTQDLPSSRKLHVLATGHDLVA